MKGSAGAILEGEKSLIIACKDKALSVTEIQRAGKKKMTIKEVLNGFKFE
jgi:methionyl-tRNA formyltransferase